jgi:hypothetical protein
MKTQLCVAFGPSGITYTGAETGDIYVWKGVKLAFVIGQVCLLHHLSRTVPRWLRQFSVRHMLTYP